MDNLSLTKETRIYNGEIRAEINAKETKEIREKINRAKS